MKISRWVISGLLVGILGSFGCKGANMVTDPGGPQGANRGLDLTGLWSGSVFTYGGACNEESFTVTLSQSVSTEDQLVRFTGQFSTPCEGSFDIHGFLTGARLNGSISGKGWITGSASASQIDIMIMEGSGKNGQSFLNKITMHRVQ